MNRGELIDQLELELAEAMAGITPADDDVDPEEEEEPEESGASQE